MRSMKTNTEIPLPGKRRGQRHHQMAHIIIITLLFAHRSLRRAEVALACRYMEIQQIRIPLGHWIQVTRASIAPPHPHFIASSNRRRFLKSERRTSPRQESDAAHMRLYCAKFKLFGTTAYPHHGRGLRCPPRPDPRRCLTEKPKRQVGQRFLPKFRRGSGRDP